MSKFAGNWKGSCEFPTKTLFTQKEKSSKMLKYACSICREDYPDSQTLIKHFSANHSTTKCHLCEREAATNGVFCPTCRNAFSLEINSIEKEKDLLSRVELSLKKLQKAISTKQFDLKSKFLAQKIKLFCSHDIPKELTCEKCEKFNAREVHKTSNIIHIELDAFKPASLKKPQIKIIL